MLPFLAEMSPQAARQMGYALLGLIFLWVMGTITLCLIPGKLIAPVFASTISRNSGLRLQKDESWFSASLICAEIFGPMSIAYMIPMRHGPGFLVIQVFTLFYSLLCLIWNIILFQRYRFSMRQGGVLLIPFIVVVLCVEFVAFSLKGY